MQPASCVRRSAANRFAIVLAVAAALLGNLGTSPADTASGFEDRFEATNGTLLIHSPQGSNWSVSPTTLQSQWVIETRPTTLNTAQLGTASVLVNRSRAITPSEPIAFVKKDMANFVAQTQAAFDRTVPVNSGVGLAFRAPVDPNTGAVDRNNLYLFTSVNAAPNPRTFPTGHAFMLLKRVAGTYYIAAPWVNTWMDFSNSTFHTYKVSMVGERIQAWVDGLRVFDLVDSPGDDAPAGSMFKMPGPAFVSGAVGVRSSGTQALFDDVLISGAPAYEGRAAAISVYGQAGLSNGLTTQQAGIVPAGVEQSFTGGDTGFQYHDHDFQSAVNGPLTSPGGNLAIASLYTQGVTDPDTQVEQTNSTAQMAGFGGIFSDPNQRTTVSIAADLLRASAAATCGGSNSTVDVVNLTWEVTHRDANGNVTTTQGNTTRFNAPPNTNLLDPRHQTGTLPSVPNGPDPNTALQQMPVRITLHSRQVSSEPHRMEAAAIRITFLQSTNVAPDRASVPGNIVADVALADVVAGKLCTP